MRDNTLTSLFALIILGIIAVFAIVYHIDHGLLSLLASIIGGIAGYRLGTRKGI